MPRMALVAILCVVCFLVTSCSTISITAPPGKKVALLSETDSGTYRTSKKVWYVLWGLVPITDNSTEDIIAQRGLSDVKAKTQYDFVDILISLFLGGLTINTHTVVIEGTPSR